VPFFILHRTLRGEKERRSRREEERRK